ncbi:hypothetical protein DFH06DRAFT_1159254 [Mycena polygramma]|nr:hypothetical protein DFH06DRAFT_1159254 [Mycena polygramma]
MAQPYVRDAGPSDFEEISSFEARAFADDPEMNWFGGLSTAIADERPPRNGRSLENLRIFLDSVNRSVHLVSGRVMVVAVPQDSGREKLVAFAAWVPPHRVIEGTLTTIRSKAYRSLLTWGFSLLWRATVVFKPTIAAIVKQALRSRGYGDTDHWRLEITATDPEYQNKGYNTLLMRKGFAMCPSKPITLEATTPHSRDVYAHQGFEVVDALTLGKGQVDSRGLKTREKKSAVGFTVSVMIKWPTQDQT